MKKLIFIRHAKSSWEYDVDDRKRPLSNRGITDAALVSKEFNIKEFNIDAVFSSPAKRALLTCEIFFKNLNIDINLLTISEDLYDFGGQSVMSFIKKIDDSNENVMIFGHNHAFTYLVNLFGSVNIDNLPTSGLVSIDFNISTWSDIQKGITNTIIVPKHLK
jgi:phosphohistidine phosphatase